MWQLTSGNNIRCSGSTNCPKFICPSSTQINVLRMLKCNNVVITKNAPQTWQKRASQSATLPLLQGLVRVGCTKHYSCIYSGCFCILNPWYSGQNGATLPPCQACPPSSGMKNIIPLVASWDNWHLDALFHKERNKEEQFNWFIHLMLVVLLRSGPTD